MIDQARNLRNIARNKEPVSLEKSSVIPAALKRKGNAGNCRSIAITSGKGGVGKSNTTISLACALTMLNKKVMVFDGDLGLANIHILLGIAPKYNLSHFMREECSLNETVCTGPCGISIIPGASGVLSMANLELSHLESLIRDLSALENEYDFFLIDGGAGIGQASIQLCTMADSSLIIITPEPTSLADAYSVAKILFSKGMGRIDALVNMAESDKDGEDIFEKLHSLVRKFLKRELTLFGILPFDRNVSKCIRAQKNIFIEKQSSDFARRIQNAARKMAGLQPVKTRGFFARLIGTTLSKGTVQ